MVAVGGGVGTDENGNQWATDPDHVQRQAELYDPRGRRWRPGPVAREDRAYHGTALLLPDGSVVVAGDDDPYDDPSPLVDTYEIYKPPYFFKSRRPRITSAPSTAGYRRTIRVGTRSTNIARAVLMSPGANTHAVDMNARMIRLPVRRRGRGYDVRTPINANVALPGYHMLFLVDRRGRPSEARWLRLERRARGSRRGPT